MWNNDEVKWNSLDVKKKLESFSYIQNATKQAAFYKTKHASIGKVEFYEIFAKDNITWSILVRKTSVTWRFIWAQFSSIAEVSIV